MKKALPIGVDDYRRLKENNYYAVDKTLMIEEFLQRQSIVTLITRPRRFGKTLNMSMMAEFFDITKDSKEIFNDTNITKSLYASNMNQYPTIFVSFANAKGDQINVVQQIKEQLRNEYNRYEHIFNNLSKFEEDDYKQVIDGLMSKSDGKLNNIIDALSFLMKILEKYYQRKVMLFIDEYDTPFIEAHVNGFYDKIKNGLASLLHNSLKTSNSLQYALLTGIQRVAKENIFSDLNNLVVCTVKDHTYDKYFGFNEQETKELLEYYDLKLNEDVKGRALIKHKYISMMQVYVPVPFKDDVEFITNLKATIQEIANKYTGEKLIGIPVLPDVFTTKDFKNYKNESTDKNLVGLSLDNVENVSIDLSNTPYLILGPSKCGKTNFLEILINQRDGKSYIFDADGMDLYKYKGKENINYVSSPDELKDFIEDLFTEIEDRKTKAEEALSNGNYVSPKSFYNELPEWSVYIDDVDIFIQKVQTVSNISNLLNQAVSVGIKFIATVNSNKLKGFDEVSKFFKNSTNGAILGQMGTLSIFALNMRDIPSFGYAVLSNNNELKKIKVPQYVGFEG